MKEKLESGLVAIMVWFCIALPTILLLAYLQGNFCEIIN